MKLKTFNPVIVTRNAEAVIAFNERMYGFKVIHKTENHLGDNGRGVRSGKPGRLPSGRNLCQRSGG